MITSVSGIFLGKSVIYLFHDGSNVGWDDMGICQQFSGLHATLIYIVTWTVFNDSVFRIYPSEIKCGN